MATIRDVCTTALVSLKALAPGDAMTADEAVFALDAFQQLLLEWHAGRGPMTDVDVSADYVAGADQRIRVQAGFTVKVTLPNSVPTLIVCAPNDYGFIQSSTNPNVGSTASADGYTLRQPRDGERVEITGLTEDLLYFYTADTNTWNSVYALTLDSSLPVNSRDVGHWGAKVAERMIDAWPGLYEPTPSLMRRIGRANSALLYRPGSARDPIPVQYF